MGHYSPLGGLFYFMSGTCSLLLAFLGNRSAQICVDLWQSRLARGPMTSGSPLSVAVSDDYKMGHRDKQDQQHCFPPTTIMSTTAIWESTIASTADPKEACPPSLSLASSYTEKLEAQENRPRVRCDSRTLHKKKSSFDLRDDYNQSQSA